jgi:hypothetical protein
LLLILPIDHRAGQVTITQHILLNPAYPMPSVDNEPRSETPDSKPREYDTTGIYPAEGKPFRLWALLFWNVAVIVVIAIASALLNYILL